MPRTTEQIIADAERLAAHFEDGDFDATETLEGDALREVYQAFRREALAAEELASAVARARGKGHSWTAIGTMLGTTGEAARQRSSWTSHDHSRVSVRCACIAASTPGRVVANGATPPRRRGIRASPRRR